MRIFKFWSCLWWGTNCCLIKARLSPSGPLPIPHSVYITCSEALNFSCITEEVDCDSFWRIESTGTTPLKQNSDAEFLQQYLDNNITVQPKGTYSPKFPWKTNHPTLPTNYTVCAKRTRSMAIHLGKTPHLLKLYNSVIEEQSISCMEYTIHSLEVQKRVIERVLEPPEMSTNEERVFGYFMQIIGSLDVCCLCVL